MKLRRLMSGAVAFCMLALMPLTSYADTQTVDDSLSVSSGIQNYSESTEMVGGATVEKYRLLKMVFRQKSQKRLFQMEHLLLKLLKDKNPMNCKDRVDSQTCMLRQLIAIQVRRDM